jgi:hypothetical protein
VVSFLVPYYRLGSTVTKPFANSVLLIALATLVLPAGSCMRGLFDPNFDKMDDVTVGEFDPDARVRLAVLRRLRRVDLDSWSLGYKLRGFSYAMEDPDPRVRRLARRALSPLVPRDPRAVCLSLEAGEVYCDSVQRALDVQRVLAMYLLGVDVTCALPSLKRLSTAPLPSRGGDDAEWSVVVLCWLGHPPAGAIEKLTELAAGGGRWMRAHAIRGLGILKAKASRHVLERLRDDPDEEMSWPASLALQRMARTP